MTSTVAPKTRKPPSRAARRTGYVFSIIINAALLFGVNIWPGWDVLPFLSDDFTEVLTLLNVALWVSLAVNVLYLLNDATRVKAVGDIVTLSVSLALGVLMWRVFPFDFGTQTFDWSLVFRILIGFGIFGIAVAVIANVVSLVTGRPSKV